VSWRARADPIPCVLVESGYAALVEKIKRELSETKQ